MMRRRDFLAAAGLLGISPLALGMNFERRLLKKSLRQYFKPSKGDGNEQRVLVLVHLAGGNDGLNTVIPVNDPAYYKSRPTLAIAKSTAIPLNADLALHPGMKELAQVYGDKQMTILQGVGYPEPNRSHFRSLEIWETASSSAEDIEEGWVARFLKQQQPDNDDPTPQAIHLGTEIPDVLYTPQDIGVFGLARRRIKADALGPGMEQLEREAARTGDERTEGNLAYVTDVVLDTLATEQEIASILRKDRSRGDFPKSGFSRRLRSVASLIDSGLSTRVYHVSLGGFDTHANQANRHTRLLRTLSAGLTAFQKDLQRRGVAGRVMTMTYSEFGRRPWENESGGTDHGTAAPIFLLGEQARSGVVGPVASIPLDPAKDLGYETDFRAVYAAMLEDWFEVPAKTIVPGNFSSIKVLKNGA